MYYRSKFITNSSTTSFVAWGIVVPMDRLKEKPDAFYDKLYDGDEIVDGCSDDDNYLVYIRETEQDLDDYYGTICINTFGNSVKPEWAEVLREQCKNLGLNIEGLSPGWFFTHHAS